MKPEFTKTQEVLIAEALARGTVLPRGIRQESAAAELEKRAVFYRPPSQPNRFALTARYLRAAALLPCRRRTPA